MSSRLVPFVLLLIAFSEAHDDEIYSKLAELETLVRQQGSQISKLENDTFHVQFYLFISVT